MTTEQTAQQLELAAQILRTGHPWGYRHIAGSHHKYNTPIEVVADGNFLSPLLATPPDNRPLHNPDNLTAEQVGVGYRLALKGESAASPHDFWDGDTWKKAKLLGPAIFAWCCRSCRLPLSVPWPEPEKPDPYAELKAAHAAGKAIQILNTQNRYVDADPTWQSPPERYRIKPEPAFQLPPPPPGMRWHREDGWTADDLPQGYRPCVVDEREAISGHMESMPDRNSGLGWVGATYHSSGLDFYSFHHRTTRSLTFEHAGKTWTWHRPGDPMPCDGEREVVTLLEDLDIGGTIRAGRFDWGQRDDGEQIIGWRYADPQTKTVPLGPEDVPPGSVMRPGHWSGHAWIKVNKVCNNDCALEGEDEGMPYEYLHVQEYQINRSIPLTGKWNPDAWEPCSKQTPV